MSWTVWSYELYAQSQERIAREMGVKLLTPERIRLGLKVRTLQQWAGVPVGTTGLLVATYTIGNNHSGVDIVWDGMDGLRDGFNTDEFKYLEVLDATK